MGHALHIQVSPRLSLRIQAHSPVWVGHADQQSRGMEDSSTLDEWFRPGNEVGHVPCEPGHVSSAVSSERRLSTARSVVVDIVGSAHSAGDVGCAETRELSPRLQ